MFLNALTHNLCNNEREEPFEKVVACASAGGPDPIHMKKYDISRGGPNKILWKDARRLTWNRAPEMAPRGKSDGGCYLGMRSCSLVTIAR